MTWYTLVEETKMTGKDVLQALQDGKTLKRIDWDKEEFILLKNKEIHMSNKLEWKIEASELGIADNVELIIESLLFFEWEEVEISKL